MTIFLTVYGQIVIKWQVNSAGIMPVELNEKMGFMLRLLLNPWVMSGFVSAFLAAISWMGAMSKFPISYAYPFMSLAFVLVLIFSNIFFKEPITIGKTIGMGFIVLGIIFGSKG
jgi:drug/metabolite transporter (DMT)-like permease